MKKGTIIWSAVLLIYFIVLAVPDSREGFNVISQGHPYLMGFLNFAILATLGELLALRLANGVWARPSGVQWRVLVWGLIGVLITLVFQIFSAGVIFSMETGYLPRTENKLLIALLTSASMNLLFAPTFMMAHKIAETTIELKCGEKVHSKITRDLVIQSIDWNNLVTFVYLKTIPFFWIPAHTIVFLVPPDYRVILAAGLSVVMGVILSKR